MKTPTPRVVMVSGSVIDFKEEQPLNASSPIVVNVFGRVTVIKREQFMKARSLIALIIGGIVMHSRVVQS